MTELAYLLESNVWENITGTYYYKKSTGWGGVNVTTSFWRCNCSGTLEKRKWQMKLQTGLFKKKHVKPSFRYSVNFSQAATVKTEVWLCCCLIPRLSLEPVSMGGGWKKCNTLGDRALESTLNLTCQACRQALPDFQGLLQQCEVYSVSLLFFRLKEQL